MKLKYVEIENILSIQNIRLDFGETGLILLDGWNYDDETANGAGKTAILNSIAYGIYGEFPRKVSAADILRQGTKSGYVKVGIELGSHLYEIRRARPNNLKFYVDGLEKDMSQEEFEKEIRLSYSQYLISMYSAQTQGLKLISLNDGGKKDFFLQLMNLDHFELARKEAEGQLNLLNASKRKLETTIQSLTSRIEAYTESLVDVSDIEDRIKELDTTALSSKLKKLETLDKPDTSKIDALEQKVQEQLGDIKVAEQKAVNIVDRRSSLANQIARLKNPGKSISCPHCSTSFVPGHTHNQDQIDELAAELKTLVLDDTDFDEQREKLRVLLSKCKIKRASSLEDYNESVRTIAELKSSISRRESQIASFQEGITKNDTIQEKISDARASIQTFQAQIVDFNQNIELYETVSALFSTTGAPAYVLDSAVDVFNEKVETYTSLIWPNASYALQSFKENKSGEVKAKFSEKLVIGGKDRSIGALSGGEHRCLSLAVDFAVIDVLETMFGISMNPIMLDEPFNDLDASNRERVLELLDKISATRQIWIIDHASESKSMFTNTVRVEKRNSISFLSV